MSRRKNVRDRIRKIRKRFEFAVTPVGNFTIMQWEYVCSVVGNKCLACHQQFGGPLELVRHYIVTSNGNGLSNSIYNIQPLCKECSTRAIIAKKDADYRTPVYRAAQKKVIQMKPEVLSAVVSRNRWLLDKNNIELKRNMVQAQQRLDDMALVKELETPV